jgi:hypothetical protein
MKKALGMVRIPMVGDANVWRTFGVHLSNQWHVLGLPNLGWTIIFKRDPAGTNPPTVKPSTFPVDEINPIESPLCASVILPEPGGLKQYWVTVLDQTTWAQLSTPNWIVEFLRDEG